MGSKFTCDLRWLGLRPTQLSELRLGREVVGLGQVLFFVVVRWNFRFFLFPDAGNEQIWYFTSSNPQRTLELGRLQQNRTNEVFLVSRVKLYFLKFFLSTRAEANCSFPPVSSDEIDCMKKTQQKCELEALISRSFDSLSQFIVSVVRTVLLMNYRRFHYKPSLSGTIHYKERLHLKTQVKSS